MVLTCQSVSQLPLAICGSAGCCRPLTGPPFAPVGAEVVERRAGAGDAVEGAGVGDAVDAVQHLVVGVFEAEDRARASGRRASVFDEQVGLVGEVLDLLPALVGAQRGGGVDAARDCWRRWSRCARAGDDVAVVGRAVAGQAGAGGQLSLNSYFMRAVTVSTSDSRKSCSCA